MTRVKTPTTTASKRRESSPLRHPAQDDESVSTSRSFLSDPVNVRPEPHVSMDTRQKVAKGATSLRKSKTRRSHEKRCRKIKAARAKAAHGEDDSVLSPNRRESARRSQKSRQKRLRKLQKKHAFAPGSALQAILKPDPSGSTSERLDERPHSGAGPSECEDGHYGSPNAFFARLCATTLPRRPIRTWLSQMAPSQQKMSPEVLETSVASVIDIQHQRERSTLNSSIAQETTTIVAADDSNLLDQDGDIAMTRNHVRLRQISLDEAQDTGATDDRSCRNGELPETRTSEPTKQDLSTALSACDTDTENGRTTKEVDSAVELASAANVGLELPLTRIVCLQSYQTISDLIPTSNAIGVQQSGRNDDDRSTIALSDCSSDIQIQRLSTATILRSDAPATANRSTNLGFDVPKTNTAGVLVAPTPSEWTVPGSEEEGIVAHRMKRSVTGLSSRHFTTPKKRSKFSSPAKHAVEDGFDLERTSELCSTSDADQVRSTSNADAKIGSEEPNTVPLTSEPTQRMVGKRLFVEEAKTPKTSEMHFVSNVESNDPAAEAPLQVNSTSQNSIVGVDVAVHINYDECRFRSDNIAHTTNDDVMIPKQDGTTFRRSSRRLAQRGLENRVSTASPNEPSTNDGSDQSEAKLSDEERKGAPRKRARPVHDNQDDGEANSEVVSPQSSSSDPDEAQTPKTKRRFRAGVSTAPVPSTSCETFGLIQEKLWKEPFWLLIAVTFLNQTTGRAAAPTFWELKAQYKTAEALAEADQSALCDMIYHLGLYNIRSRRVIEMAKEWVRQPPSKGIRHRTLHYPQNGDGKDLKKGILVEEDNDDCAGTLEIGHMPGCGRYAYDSWRIFCRDVLRGVATDYNGGGRAEDDCTFTPEWKKVLPLDKELRACLRWMWLRDGWIWNETTGEITPATEEEKQRGQQGEMDVPDLKEGKFAAEAAAKNSENESKPRKSRRGRSKVTVQKSQDSQMVDETEAAIVEATEASPRLPVPKSKVSKRNTPLTHRPRTRSEKALLLENDSEKKHA